MGAVFAAGWEEVVRACRIRLAAADEELRSREGKVRGEVEALRTTEKEARRGRLRMRGRRHLDVADELAAEAVSEEAYEAAIEAFIRLLEEWPDVGEDVLGEWHQRAREECYRLEERAAAGRDQPAGLLISGDAGRVWELVGLDDTVASLRRGGPGEQLWDVWRGVVGGASDPAEIAVANADAAALVARLTERERSVVLLRASGLTLRDVALELRRSRTYVVKVLGEARRRLAAVGFGISAVFAGWWRRRTHDRPRLRQAADVVACTIMEPLGIPGGPLAGMALALLATGTVSATFDPPSAASEGSPIAIAAVPARALLTHPSGAVHDVARPGAVGKAPPLAGAPIVGPEHPPLLVLGGHDETPQDTELVAAAPAPDYPRSRTIVALGYGRSCQCTVLYRTRDGGTTWQERDAAPGANQVVLPPDYPADPRIFLGTDAQGGIPPYVVDSFDALPRPLASPAGHVALSGAYAAGDHRIFVATRGAIAIVDVDDGRLENVVLGYGGAATPALVASAGVTPPLAAYVWVPSSRIGPAASGLYACTSADGGCSLVNDSLPGGLTGLEVSNAASGSVVLGQWSGVLHLSTDAGHTFTATAAPSPGDVMGMSISGGRGWALVSDGASPSRLEALDVATGQWGASLRAPLSGGRDVIVALGGDYVLALLPAGVLCTGDAGLTWTASCP